VKRVTEYDSFEALLDHEDTVAIGEISVSRRDQLLTVIREIYPPEKEKLGVLAIQIERA
jgi:ASC-1-like (ASCH) protein